MFTKVMFIWYMATGVVVPQSDVDGRDTYAIFFENNTVIDYAYTGEVLNWIRTGEFVYDENLKDL
jgi:hypothetical protein